MDWGETDSFLSQRDFNLMADKVFEQEAIERERREAERRAYEKRKQMELIEYEKIRERERQRSELAWGRGVRLEGTSLLQHKSEPLSLKGIRDAITTIKEEEKETGYDFTQVSKWMEEAYEKFLTPMASHASGYMRIKPRDMEGNFVKVGIEPNYLSALRPRSFADEYLALPFSRSEEDEERKKLMDLITDVSPEESPMAKMFSSTTTATEHQWLKYEKKNDSKAHDLFWQSYRRTGKLPFTATHHKKD